MPTYHEVLARNVEAYDGAVAERASHTIAGWKRAEHDAFRARLDDHGCRTVVDVGAGTGCHAAAFAGAGFEVLCTDPSPAMVAHCRSLGLVAEQADVLNLTLERPVDAAFAMNSLLHVPAARLPDALARIRAAIRPGGLCYIGLYGGIDSEGPRDEDHYVPKRWFVSHSDDRLLQVTSAAFDVIDFHTVELGSDDHVHFQSLSLRTAERPGRSATRATALR